MNRALELGGEPSSAGNSTVRVLGRASQVGLCVVLALVFALVLSGREIPAALDDEAYLTYAAFSADILDAKLQESSLFALFFAEPLWLQVNSTLALFFDAEVVLRIIIFCSALLAFISVAKLVDWNALLCVAFFLYPLGIVPYVTHLRQGTAIAVFLAFLAFMPRKISIGTFFAAAIHTSFVPIWALLVAERNALLRNFFRKVSSQALWAAWLAIILLTALILRNALEWAGDRRVDEYSFAIDQTATGLGFLLWLGIAIVLFVGRKSAPESMLRPALAILTLYLGWYFLFEFGSRVLTSGLVFIWLAGSNLSTNSRNLFFSIWGLAGIYSWIKQIDNTHLFGF